MTDHDQLASHHAQLAIEELKNIDDPARRAQVHATLALMHAVLEAGQDVGGLAQPLRELQDTVQFGG